jgi:hypothetical protein
MKALLLGGVLLIILGAVALVYQGINYTTSKKVVDAGPLQISHKETHTVPLPPILGAIAIAGGIALLVIGSRKSKVG